jgi:hypothetical protein
MTPEQELTAAINAAANDAELVAACDVFIAEVSTRNLAGVIAGSVTGGAANA